MHVRLNRPARFVAVAAIPFVFAGAMPVADGLTYEFVAKSTSAATGNKESVTMRGRGTYAGDEAKIEILEASAAAGGRETFGGKGTYFIVKKGDMYLVNPAEKTYMKWDMASMLAGMGKLMGAVGGIVKMEMSDISISTQDLGAGETVQGYPTRHVQMVQNYTMSTSVFGRKSKQRSETKTDFYFAPSLRVANPFVTNNQAISAMGDMFNNPDYKTQMMAAQAKLPKGGVPLKTVTTAVSTDEKGKTTTSVSTMEMVNFQKSNIPSSAFAIPSDYKMIEMPNLNSASLANGGGDAKNGQTKESFNADSVAAAAKEGAKEGVKETVKDEAKKATVKKIKGIFKR